MDKEELMRNIFLGVSLAFAIAFAFCGILCFVLVCIRSVWFLALAFICVFCCGGAAGVAFYFVEN